VTANPYEPPRSRVADVGPTIRTVGQWVLWFYLSIEGRIARRSFWSFFMLPSLMLGLGLFFLVHGNEDLAVLEWVSIAAFLWPSIAVQVKRWHDVNLSGWWILANLFPVIGHLAALVTNGFVRGTTGVNRFGADPLARNDAQADASKEMVQVDGVKS
jgi:uncharacterized membrane protein YhaH (DUF805 family)